MSTSCQIQSWLDLQKSLKGRKKIIHDVLRLKEQTLFDLCSWLSLPINEVSGRVSELVKMGLVGEVGKKINPRSGKNVTVYRAKQVDMFF